MTPERSPWSGRRVTVMGLGLFGGGAGTARHFARAGAHVTVTDLRDAETLRPSVDALSDLDPVQFVLGEHRAEDFSRADLVVPNPAVPPDNAWLELARSSGARVASDMELFIESCPARLAAVTGTQGKTSTATFLHQLLDSAGRRAHLGGNVGGSLWPEVGRMSREDVVVLELSSYQLEALALGSRPGRLARLDAVAVTNVTSDHLERHGTLERYLAAKRAILGLLADSGVAFVNAQDASGTWPLERGRRVAHGPGAELRVDGDRFRLGAVDLGSSDALGCGGGFQVRNALLAAGLAHALGVSAETLRSCLARLRSPEHRMQDLGLRRGRRVFDNGVSTTPDSTRAALESLAALAPGAGPCDLLCGGRLKDLPAESLAALVRAVSEHARRAICFGESAPVLAECLAPSGVDVQTVPSLRDAVERAFASDAAPLLFSPACASFDAYPNFKARADEFRSFLPPLDR